MKRLIAHLNHLPAQVDPALLREREEPPLKGYRLADLTVRYMQGEDWRQLRLMDHRELLRELKLIAASRSTDTRTREHWEKPGQTPDNKDTSLWWHPGETRAASLARLQQVLETP